eukprot:TRINITY_DN9490_c0_g1_i1.p1 TRINITY_DN9490_c0_g1~~TRINITY_DN9490_c0_g1_i1.p1  ORF type:complete len:164 (+),score=34.48 TRINITY_DN9490_c0_g1_i1:117-608(+)
MQYQPSIVDHHQGLHTPRQQAPVVYYASSPVRSPMQITPQQSRVVSAPFTYTASTRSFVAGNPYFLSQPTIRGTVLPTMTQTHSPNPLIAAPSQRPFSAILGPVQGTSYGLEVQAISTLRPPRYGRLHGQTTAPLPSYSWPSSQMAAFQPHPSLVSATTSRAK